jgi:hypothetical protein
VRLKRQQAAEKGTNRDNTRGIRRMFQWESIVGGLRSRTLAVRRTPNVQSQFGLCLSYNCLALRGISHRFVLEPVPGLIRLENGFTV